MFTDTGVGIFVRMERLKKLVDKMKTILKDIALWTVKVIIAATAFYFVCPRYEYTIRGTETFRCDKITGIVKCLSADNKSIITVNTNTGKFTVAHDAVQGKTIYSAEEAEEARHKKLVEKGNAVLAEKKRIYFVDALKEAGFNELEIGEYISTKYKEYKSLGFTDKEINDYLGGKSEPNQQK